MDKMQRVQNCAVRLIAKNNIPSSGLDRKMFEYHWLHVRHRILYKMMLIVHKCVNFKAPEEIMTMFNFCDSARTMNFQETKFLNKYGEEAFSHNGPKLWNLVQRQSEKKEKRTNSKRT